MIVLDRLPLGAGLALLVVASGPGDPEPVPWVVGEDRRALPGDHAAEALVALLAAGSRTIGRFRITAWEGGSLRGERSFGVDQTNESVVVGERAVVKWMRTAERGPHPAPPMLSALMAHGFTGTPRPWGLVEWQGPDDASPRLLVSVDTLVEGAVDGWTWAVDDVRAAVLAGSAEIVEASGARVGALIAAMHAALASTGRAATVDDVGSWSSGALGDLERALEVTTGRAHELLTARRDRVRELVVPPQVAGTPLILVHGDCHVGQLLRAGDDLVVTDFDGNPVVPAGQRTTPQPAALDVAGMAQSLAHAAYVLRRHEPAHPLPAVRAMSDAFVSSFLSSYVAELADRGAADLFEPALVPGFRLRQICREFTYAAVHLPRWSYVPEAAIVDLLPDPPTGDPMKPDLFLADLQLKPEALAALTVRLREGNPWSFLDPAPKRVVLLGMGSSTYAAGVAAARLRARGMTAVAELASSDLLPAWGEDTVVVAISASGGSKETLDALTRLAPGATLVALTNVAGSPVTATAAHTVLMGAGTEEGGVACRSYQHTLALLLALEAHLAGVSLEPLLGTLERVAEATEHLLATEADWRPEIGRLLDGPHGCSIAAPARRLGSAQQSALMLREGPRRSAIACESGDWAHVDVYLTKNTDYRLLSLAGSAWDDGILEWTLPRSTTVVSVGGELEGAAFTLRYPHDTDDDVRLLTEVLVAELVAARLWLEAS